MNTIPMSKTAAIRAARRAAGTIWGSGTNWYCYVPFNRTKLDGPTTEIRASSYDAIRRARTDWIIVCALSLMGAPDRDVEEEVYAARSYCWSSQEEILNRVLRVLADRGWTPPSR